MLKEGKMIYFSADEELEMLIEEYRATLRPMPSRSEAVRQLIRLGLAANPAD